MICQQCNKEFIRSHHEKYCSKKCVKINDKKYKKEYYKKYAQSDHGKEVLKRNKEIKKERKAKNKKTVIIICSQCNKEFIRSHHEKYCSKKCAMNGAKELKRKYNKSEKGKESLKIHRQSDKFKESHEKYGQSDKGKELRRIWFRSDKHKNYIKNRKKTEPIFKLTLTVRTRLYKFLKAKNIRKKNKTFVMVGCSPAFLKKHLEKQFHRHPDTFQPMNWKNHTLHGWHIDHKIPLDKAKTPEDVEKLMHYTNLQPMWATYNLKKGNKII